MMGMAALHGSGEWRFAPQQVSRLIVPDDSVDPLSAAELAVHLLAQMPPGIAASLPASVRNRRLVRSIGLAYGVDAQVSFRSSSDRGLDLDGALVFGRNDRRTPADLLASIAPKGPQSHEVPRHCAPVDAVLNGQRVAIITNIPIHYRSALFEKLDQLLRAERSEFQVLFLAGAPPDRSWIDESTLRFSHEFVGSHDFGRVRGRRLIPRSLSHVLDRLDPTIVLSAGFSPFVSGRAANWCARRPAALGIWSGEIASRPTAQSLLRRLQRRRLVGRTDFAIAYGWQSARYLRDLGEDLPIVIGRNSGVAPERTRRHPKMPVELLVVSRAEKGKALDLLIDAVLALPDERARLTLIGDGPELVELKARAGRSGRIRFLGALSHAEVLDKYGEADVFLFPSQYDVFGLVLVEAMAAGLAVITSDRPGAVADLAASGSNCLLVCEGSAEAWAKAIRTVVDDSNLRRRLGDEACRTIRDRWTIDHSAEAMIAGLRLGVFARRESSGAT
jgi:glycosyltransferase involved in cell wall biosynthesis